MVLELSLCWWSTLSSDTRFLSSLKHPFQTILNQSKFHTPNREEAKSWLMAN